MDCRFMTFRISVWLNLRLACFIAASCVAQVLVPHSIYTTILSYCLFLPIAWWSHTWLHVWMCTVVKKKCVFRRIKFFSPYYRFCRYFFHCNRTFYNCRRRWSWRGDWICSRGKKSLFSSRWATCYQRVDVIFSCWCAAVVWHTRLRYPRAYTISK